MSKSFADLEAMFAAKALADPQLFSLLCELHQASRQYLRFLGVDQKRTEAALTRFSTATHAVTLHLERQLDEETGDA